MKVQGLLSITVSLCLILPILAEKGTPTLPFALIGRMPTAWSESLLSPFQMTQQMAGMNFYGANGMMNYGQPMSGGSGQAANQTLSPQMWK